MDPDVYILVAGRRTAFDGLDLDYEELRGLELRGLDDSEQALERLERLAMLGEPFHFADVRLDVGWRSSEGP